jgi:hypothetical protein
MPTYYVTEAESTLIRRFMVLRRSAFGLGREVGATFARDAARGWREQGIAGLELACWALHYAVAHVEGAHDVHREAADLAGAVAAV